MRKAGVYLSVAAILAVLIGAVGLPLPPLYSKTGAVHSFHSWQSEISAWLGAGSSFRYAYSTWQWLSFGFLLGTIAALIICWQKFRGWRGRHPAAWSRLFGLILTFPAMLVLVLPPIVIAALGHGQSNYVDERWSAFDAFIYGLPWMVLTIAACITTACFPKAYWRQDPESSP